MKTAGLRGPWYSASYILRARTECLVWVPIAMSEVDCHLNTPVAHDLQPFPKEQVQRTVSANLLVVTSALRKCIEPSHKRPCRFIERIREIRFSDIPMKNSKKGTENPLP